MDTIESEVCESTIERYNWLKHLQRKKHKKEVKDEELTQLAGVVDWKRCRKCEAQGRESDIQ